MNVTEAREYKNISNKTMAVVEGVVADDTTHKKLLCYNKKVFPLLKPGKSFMILNAISKPRELVATSETKLLLIPDVDVSPAILDEAKTAFKAIIQPPTGIPKTILETLELPAGTLVNVRVKVVQVCRLHFNTTGYYGIRNKEV